MGHYSSGRNLMFAGSFASSRSHLETVLALYDPNSHHSLVRQTGVHPQLAAQAALGVVFFCLGFPDQALAQSSKAIAEARRRPHPPTLAMSLGIDALLLSIIGDHIGLEQRSDGLVAVAIDQGFPRPIVQRERSSVGGQGQECRCDRGPVSSACRFERLLCHWGHGVDALVYRPPGRGM